MREKPKMFIYETPYVVCVLDLETGDATVSHRESKKDSFEILLRVRPQTTWKRQYTAQIFKLHVFQPMQMADAWLRMGYSLKDELHNIRECDGYCCNDNSALKKIWLW